MTFAKLILNSTSRLEQQPKTTKGKQMQALRSLWTSAVCSLPPAPWPLPHARQYIRSAGTPYSKLLGLCVWACRMCSTALRLLSLRLGQYKWHIKYTLSGTCDCSSVRRQIECNYRNTHTKRMFLFFSALKCITFHSLQTQLIILIEIWAKYKEILVQQGNLMNWRYKE